MKHRVFLIAALFACMLGVFAVFAQDGVKTAEFELNPPAETFDAVTGGGIFHFSFASGKTEWLPFGKPVSRSQISFWSASRNLLQTEPICGTGQRKRSGRHRCRLCRAAARMTP